MAAALGTLAADLALSLPRPGDGRTQDRFVAFGEVSALDLSLGRLFEGHADAVAILLEAGRRPPPGAVMGVWAARRPGAEVTAIRAPGGGWHLQGIKPWASGAQTVTHALVTAPGPEGDLLFEIPVDREHVSVVPGTWPAVGMAMSDSADVEIDITVGAHGVIGPPSWYVERPGFWFGSVGVAACWLGGAVGLVRALRADLQGRRPDVHQVAHLGAAMARCGSMARDIAWAAERIDADPLDPARQLHDVALEVRHLVEAGCGDVLAHVGRAGGSGPLCHDAAQSRRAADLPVYIRQHHAERDDEELGRLFLATDARR